MSRFTPGENELLVEQFTTKPDAWGRTEFALHWRGYHPGTGDGPRAQHFHAVLDTYLVRARERSQTIRFVTEDGEPAQAALFDTADEPPRVRTVHLTGDRL